MNLKFKNSTFGDAPSQLGWRSVSPLHISLSLLTAFDFFYLHAYGLITEIQIHFDQNKMSMDIENTTFHILDA